MACKKFSTSLSLTAVTCASNNRDLPGRPSSSVASTATRCWRALPFVRSAMARKSFSQLPAPGGTICRCAAPDCRSIDKLKHVIIKFLYTVCLIWFLFRISVWCVHCGRAAAE
jgi:hypothetical protein